LKLSIGNCHGRDQLNTLSAPKRSSKFGWRNGQKSRRKKPGGTALSKLVEKRAVFRALHREGCFVIPNPWDVGSARLFQEIGFAALASTSSGFAWTTGRPDYAVTRDDVLAHLATLCQAVDLPVNADFESGFADAPEDMVVNVGLAIATGIAGLSIEDRVVGGSGLYERALAVERIQAARAAIDQSGADVILVARTEGLLFDTTALTPAIDRLVAFAEAGADCLFAPGVKRREDIAAMVRAVAPKPLNVVMSGPGLSVAELADLGVRRISVGGALARMAWSAVRRAADEIRRGSFDGLKDALSSKEMNTLFAGKPD
jgi:2-methylisocitrate lyase-like PEP mutase family enzyme